MTVRVLMTVDTLGGVWTYALELAAALAPHGTEVHLATMGAPMTPSQRADVADSPVASVHESAFALEWMPQPWPDVDRAGAWLLRVADEVRPDVVHLNGYAHAVLRWPAPVVVVAHSDVLSWWRGVHGIPAPREWSTYAQRVRAGLDAAAAVVAPTAAMLDELRECYGFGGGRVVANCRRAEWVRPVRKERLVAATGRVWDEAKNLAQLERVADRLPWPVTVAGPRSVDDNTGLRSFDDVADLLLRASIYVAPARYEPFGLGTLEAAQAGCALVLGDIATLREVWGDAAVYVDPHDDESLLQAVAGLIEDPHRRAQAASAARRRAETYSPERTALDYLETYAQLRVPVWSSR